MNTDYRIIAAAMELLVRTDGGGRLVSYAGADHPSIIEQIEQEQRDGKIDLLMPPVKGYLIEYDEIPGVRTFVNEMELTPWRKPERNSPQTTGASWSRRSRCIKRRWCSLSPAARKLKRENGGLPIGSGLFPASVGCLFW